MAYDIYRPQPANIDVNLFPNSAVKGAQVGNSVPTQLTSALQGFQKGIDEGIDREGKLLANEAQALKNEAASDPDLIQAQKDKAIADAEIAQADAAAKKANAGYEQKAKVAVAKATAAEAEQKLSDLTVKDQINSALGDQTMGADELQALIQKGTPALIRDNDAAQSVLAQLRVDGRIPNATVDRFGSQIDAAEVAKRQAQMAAENIRATQAEAREKAKEIDKAVATLKATPGIGNQIAKSGDKFDYKKLQIVPSNLVARDDKGNILANDLGQAELTDGQATSKFDDDKRWLAIYDGGVIDTFPEGEGKDYRDAVQTARLRQAGIEAGGPSLSTASTSEPDKILDKKIETYAPSNVGDNKTPTLSEEALYGKTDEQRALMQAGLDRKIARTKSIPFASRQVVARVETDPVLKGQPAMVKAVLSAESGGVRGAESVTSTRGLMQVTGDTFDDMARLHPNLVDKTLKGTEEGDLRAGKAYLIDLIRQFGDINLALTAYNAGPAVVELAKKKAGGKGKSYEELFPYLRDATNELFPTKEITLKSGKKVQYNKWEVETKNYARRVQAYYSIYNG